jgi:hypothetical protein
MSKQIRTSDLNKTYFSLKRAGKLPVHYTR